MSTESELNLVKRLCILNFLELQEIKRKLNISITDVQGLNDYANAMSDSMKEMDQKIKALIRAYPHQLGETSTDLVE